jgi:hypothetical protein
MGSRLLRPDILPYFLVLIICLSAAVLVLWFDPPRTCRMEVLLCHYYNVTPEGVMFFTPGCVRICNDSADMSIWLSGYVSGSDTFIKK